MSDPTAEERITAVQKQAEGVEAKERGAKGSNYTALGVGFGLTAVAYGGPVALVTFGAGMGSSMLGSWLAEKLDAADHVADALEYLGMERIGQPGPDGPNPATVGHAIAHSRSAWGWLGGVLLGAVAAVAAGALIVATGGAAAVVLVGAAAAGGLVGGFATTTLAGAFSQVGSRTGPITTGSPDVLIADRPAARMTDVAACTKDAPPPSPIVEGSETIFINNLPLARKGHKLLCGAVIDEGVPSVVVDKTTVACATPASEVPVWLRVVVDWVSVILLARFLARSRPNLNARPKGVPEDWIAKPSKNGGGIRWVDPKNPHNSVRVMPGDPNSPYPNSRQPYVRVTRDGQALDVNGNVVSKNTPDAHIPFKDFQGPLKPGYPVFPQPNSTPGDSAKPFCSSSDGDCGEDRR